MKGPLYSAIFTPLSAVITTILSTIFLHEELHIGRYIFTHFIYYLGIHVVPTSLYNCLLLILFFVCTVVYMNDHWVVMVSSCAAY